ncbi:MAG: hypothetical protein KA296_15335, partial [Marinobacter sp.]|nr:hypothetical protein [Marinobacter sp.]
MVQKPSPNESLTHDGIIVTRGQPPCGCVIRAIANHSTVSGDTDSTPLTITNLTSPATRAYFQKNPQAARADVYLFPDRGNSELYIHVSGRTDLGKNGALILECDSVVNAASVESGQEMLNRKLMESGVTVLSDPSALAALKQLYQQHILRMIKNLLSSFMEGVHTNIEKQLEQAAEVREITRLKDMRFIFGTREAQIVSDFSLKFQAYNDHLDPALGEAKTPHRPELTMLQQPVFEDWLELRTVASHIASKNTLFVLSQLLNQLSSRDI